MVGGAPLTCVETSEVQIVLEALMWSHLFNSALNKPVCRLLVLLPAKQSGKSPASTRSSDTKPFLLIQALLAQERHKNLNS